MRRRFHLLLLVLVALPVLALARWGGEARAPWSAADRDVQARLVASRSIWRAGSSVPLVLRLRNVGNAPAEPGTLSVLLHVMHEGREAPQLEIVADLPAPAALAADGKLDIPLPELATTLGPGLYSISGTAGSRTLTPLKLRVIRPR